MPIYTTSSGATLELGEKLGAGGEGTVYACRSRPKEVIKIYRDAMEPERQKKLRDMFAMVPQLPGDLKSITAWPTDVVLEGKKVVGFMMPRVEAAEEIHVLYGPKSRKQKFPSASFKFLVHVAMNVARAFLVIHRQGVVIGDVNERLVMVAQSGVARVIDCDSFQLKGPSGDYFCDVGVAWYTPPELQGVSLRGLRRTTQHDLFGLAVMLFHILFLGRHPFAGRYHKPDDMPLEKAIKECRFAYSTDVGRTQMHPPPHTPTLTMPGQKIAAMFERAFSPEAAAGRQLRPEAQEWADALEALQGQLVVCKANAAHAHVASLATCPFCQVEAASGTELFHFVEPSGTAYVQLDVDAVWRAIGGIVLSAPIAELDVAQAKRTASLSREAYLILQARSDDKALSDAQEALLQTQLAQARALEIVKSDQAKVLEAKAFLEAFDADERQNSDLGQRLTRLQAKRGIYLHATGYMVAVSMCSAVVIAINQVIGVVLVLGLLTATSVICARTVWLGGQVRKTRAKKDAVWNTVKGGITVRVEGVRSAEQVLETSKARLSKTQMDVYTAMINKTALEQKSRIESAAVETAISEIRVRHQRVHQRYEVLRQQRILLQAELKQAQGRFDALKAEAQTLIGEIKKLEQVRRFEKEKVAQHERENQLTAYLDKFFITNEDWGRRIPKSVLATLSSYSIETAADIEWSKVEAVPGFGRMRTQTLVDWRDRKKAGFRFNPSQTSTDKLAAIDRSFTQHRRDGDRKLSKVKDQIEMLVGPLMARRHTIERELASIGPDYGQMLREEEQLFNKHVPLPVTPSPVPLRPAASPATPVAQPAAAKSNWSWKSSKPKRRRRKRRP